MKELRLRCHPWITLIYFVCIISASMTLPHPLCRLLSLLGAVLLVLFLRGRSGLRGQLLVILPMSMLAILLNPLFSHEGSTVLTYLPNGAPLTLEALFFGCSTALLLAAMIFWFSCCQDLLRGDQLLFLFAARLPSLSLLLSMALGFVPRFRVQLQERMAAQRGIGRGMDLGSLSTRLCRATRILISMLGWSLEAALDTALSMKSRGYGEGQRTSFSYYRFSGRERRLLIALLCLGLLLLLFAFCGLFSFSYYPMLSGRGPSVAVVVAFCCYALFCFAPLLLAAWEGHRWNSIAWNN